MNPGGTVHPTARSANFNLLTAAGASSVHAAVSVRAAAPAVPAARADADFLRETLAALDAGGIRFARLRDDDEEAAAPAREREVDLLMAADQLPRAAWLLKRRGFARLPAWGHAPHAFFVAFDTAHGVWWKLDIVTELRYGRPVRFLEAGDVEGCLLRAGADRRLAPGDEITGLLLHCLLDDGRVTPKHQRRLAAILRELSRDPLLMQRAAAQVDRWLGPSLPWNEAADAIQHRAWERLARRRHALARQLFLRRPAASLRRYLSARVLRAARPLLNLLRRRGLVVALLGPDGVGKTTLARALADEPHLRARRIYMGAGGEADDAWRSLAPLRLAAGTGPLRKGLAFAARLVEQWRRSALAHAHRLRGHVVIFDRYTPEPRGRVGLARRVRRWLVRVGVPRADLVIVLDAPAEVLFQRKREHSPERLDKMRRGYLAIAARAAGVVIDTREDVESVKGRIIQVIWSRLNEPRRRRPA
jgi:thymidylate kinase